LRRRLDLSECRRLEGLQLPPRPHPSLLVRPPLSFSLFCRLPKRRRDGGLGGLGQGIIRGFRRRKTRSAPRLWGTGKPPRTRPTVGCGGRFGGSQMPSLSIASSSLPSGK
jgi:hypothetical protein